MPPPPSCAARRVHAAGNATLKLIGRAVAAVSTGSMMPSTRQYPGALAVAAVHAGEARVTRLTGSPIAGVGMVVPIFAAVQSAAPIVTVPPASVPGPGAAGAGT